MRKSEFEIPRFELDSRRPFYLSLQFLVCDLRVVSEDLRLYHVLHYILFGSECIGFLHGCNRCTDLNNLPRQLADLEMAASERFSIRKKGDSRWSRPILWRVVI